MITYPNQKTITIHRNRVSGTEGETFLAISRTTLEEAARDLTGNELKLYLFLASDKDGFRRAFSPKYFGITYGVSADTARKLVIQLIKKGYLVDKGRNHLEFFEVPQNKTNLSNLIKRKLVEQDEGDTKEMTYKEFKEEALKEGWEEKEIEDIWDTLPDAD